MHVWLQRYFLPDVVLHVPLAERKGLSRWRKCEVPGRVGDGVIPVPAVCLLYTSDAADDRYKV